LSCCIAAIADLQAVLDLEIHRQEVCRGAEAGDADALALEVGDRLDLWVLGRNQLDFAGRLAELHHRFNDLALALQIDGMVIEADDALDRARQHFVFGVNARRFVQQLDVEPLVLEIAERLGELGGQVNVLFIAANHQADLVGEGDAGRPQGENYGG
jgi:hypothetical protein